MLEAIRNAYAVFEQLNISMTGLIVIGVILCLAFLFSVREAAAWFFKIDDLKRDIRSLRELSGQLESEIMTLKSLITQAKAQAQLNIVPPAVIENQESAAAGSKQAKSSFPIMH